MTNLGALSLLIGSLFPILASVLRQNKLPRWANMAIIIIACAGAGVLTVLVGNQFNWAAFNSTNILITIGLIFVASQAVYSAYWKGSTVVQVIDAKTQI